MKSNVSISFALAIGLSNEEDILRLGRSFIPHNLTHMSIQDDGWRERGCPNEEDIPSIRKILHSARSNPHADSG
jgi:hypothetical protein